ncbi:MAG: hypothetical protein F6K61_01390 [Sphaerospermopsis sp. SIO1G1]|nr:hypothetical protein [Sphaerospermopsis sp. SIO1G1]
MTSLLSPQVTKIICLAYIDDLTSEGFIVHIAFWGHAAKEVQEAATKFINLDPHQDYLSASWCRND